LGNARERSTGGSGSGESWNPLTQCEVEEVKEVKGVKDRDEARSKDGSGMKGGLEKRALQS
jgi:hypothetical protein